jgi:hypothetical protein
MQSWPRAAAAAASDKQIIKCGGNVCPKKTRNSQSATQRRIPTTACQDRARIDINPHILNKIFLKSE